MPSARVVVVVRYTIYVNNLHDLYRCAKFEYVLSKSNNFGGREPFSHTIDCKVRKGKASLVLISFESVPLGACDFPDLFCFRNKLKLLIYSICFCGRV